ncbi:LysR family transcriptional regulator [Actinomycetospora sp. NBRC 106375]|uniref:LysR family transcriptional regulator n=1 Tax=Actinomycetospora sp. NBRC 106375 TaxID=3032207 RepID=UPI0024A17E85|nr:LysR family transcriptional regulator [Actinomycetospora sp. NBRC 106375]GLZ47762.1 LysR family transcriptional regulator [Actinomycetospora sp. NBRC 106375]
MIDHRLRTLQLVAHHGSVTAAAQVLHFTPSAVSQQLRGLSEELGVDLVTQVGRRMEPTAAGRILLRHADALHARAESARAELAAVGDAAGRIGLCGFSTAMTLLAPTAAALRARFPDLEIQVREAEPARCIDLLLSGDGDLALLVVDDRVPPITDTRFDQRPLFDDRIDLAVPAGHRLTTRSRLSLRDAARESWIVSPPESPYYRLLLSACQAAGFRPAVAHYSAEWDTGAALVAHGLGVYLLPRLAPLHRDDVVRIPLTGPSAPVRHIAALTRAGAAGQPTIAHALGTIDGVVAEILAG